MHARRTLIAFLVAGCQPPAPPPFITEADAAIAIPQATCATAFDCACPRAPWPDPATCEQALGQRTDDTAMVAAEVGLRYDGVCVARRLQRIDRLGCEAEDVDDERAAACAEACKAYVGTIEAGQTCQRFGVTVDLDDCAQGLHCSDDRTCVPLCEGVEPLAEGERCMAGIEILGECDAGLFCDPADGDCRVAASLGEPCDQRPCAADGFCDLAQQPRTCVPRANAGERCSTHDACASGLCLDDACAPIVPIACEL
jgi:hypothetical protein